MAVRSLSHVASRRDGGSEGQISGPYSFAVHAIVESGHGRPTTRRAQIPAISSARWQLLRRELANRNAQRCGCRADRERVELGRFTACARNCEAVVPPNQYTSRANFVKSRGEDARWRGMFPASLSFDAQGKKDEGGRCRHPCPHHDVSNARRRERRRIDDGPSKNRASGSAGESANPRRTLLAEASLGARYLKPTPQARNGMPVRRGALAWRRRIRGLGACVLAVLAFTGSVAGDARAADPEKESAAGSERAQRRTVLVEGLAGLGTPLGWLGGSLVVAPIAPLAFHVGAGIGSQSPQLSLGARGRISVGPRSRLGLGGSWSTGEHAGVEGVPLFYSQGDPIFFWRRAHFVNLEGGLEVDTGTFVIRPFVGVGYVVNGPYGSRTVAPSSSISYEIRSCDCSPVIARLVPFAGFAIAFGVL